ncbi:hypothetical protein Tco_1285098 [Tanacetum coccineum]
MEASPLALRALLFATPSSSPYPYLKSLDDLPPRSSNPPPPPLDQIKNPTLPHTNLIDFKPSFPPTNLFRRGNRFCSQQKTFMTREQILEEIGFEPKIKELKMTLAQQTKDFEDAKDDFSKKADKFETYFEKLERTRVVLERQLDRKIQDSKAEKEQFLKHIASLESKLASQDLTSNQKEYSALRTLYNALKAKFDALNWIKGNLQFQTFKHQK